MPIAPGRGLREDCVRQALAIIEESGVEALSLRDVARRLHVSHQAPYKHFPSRDHLLAEIVRRAFAAFASHLDALPPLASARADMGAMGAAYLAYARAHPLQYRLMFGTPLPEPRHHPAMMQSAQHAFSLLRQALARQMAEEGVPPDADVVERDALFVWASLHGLASILGTHALAALHLPASVLADAGHHTLQCIGAALASRGSSDGSLT